MTPRVLASVVGLAVIASAAQSIPPTSFRHDWVKAHAISIQSVDAETGFADLQPLKDAIGDARIVALGEATHGTREIYQLRHRLTEFLASELGFSLIAIPDAPHGTREWRRHEVMLGIPAGAVTLNLGVLMRGKGAAWFDDLRVEVNGNADADHAFDSDFESDRLDASFTAIEGYAVTIDKTTASRGNHSLQIERQRTPGEVSAAEVARRLAALVGHMEKSKAGYLAKADARTVERVIQYARGLQHQAQWLSGEESRDETMARQVRAMMDAAPSARLVLWAHNEHVGRLRGSFSRMGARLADWYGTRYVPVGFALDRGEYLAFDPRTRSVRPHSLTPAGPGSYEYEFARAGISRFVLDLRAAQTGDAASGWLRSPMLFRSIGAVAGDQQFRSTNISELFDLVVFLADTMPTSGLSDREQRPWRDQGEVRP